MRTNGKEKKFDAVKMMREIRDKLDREIEKMSFAEEKAYLEKLLAKSRRNSSRKAELTQR